MLIVMAGCGRVAFEPRTIDDSGTAGGDGAVDALAPDAPPGATVTVFGETATADVTGVTFDTTLNSANTGNNYGAQQYLSLGPALTPVLRFDLTTIPTSATVFDAKLTLHTSDNATLDTVTAHRLLEAWDEGNNIATAGVANYLQRQAGVMWTGPGAMGGSRVASSVGAFMPMAVNSTYTFVVATSTIQAWVANPATNNGIVLDLSGTDDVGFQSSEFATSNVRPFLRVTYVP